MRLNRNLLASAAALILVVAGLALGYSMLGPVQDQRAITAGIDIGATEIFVAVPADRATETLRLPKTSMLPRSG